MATHPEVLTQLARILGNDRLRESEPKDVQEAVDGQRERLIAGLLEEAAASDDVTDKDSAMSYFEDRVAFFGEFLNAEQKQAVLEALRGRIEAW